MRRGLDRVAHSRRCSSSAALIGWKEFELEVMRDHDDNVVIVCSIENLDPMGVHTGDSITVAPAMTLTDREYQVMRDAAVAIIREIGVEAGGCNIQFAVNPRDGEMLVIEMNPRVSRSSALASKATGFPIARIGAKLAVGYRLDEIPNDITKTTPACFEPVLDYVVVKCPRFAFEKFPGANPYAHHADEVGGRVDGDRAHVQGGVPEGAARARDRARRAGRSARGSMDDRLPDDSADALRGALRQPTPERIFQVKRAFAARHVGGRGRTSSRRSIPWFLQQMHELVDAEREYAALRRRSTRSRLRRMKRMGFSDVQLGGAPRRDGARGARAAVGARRASRLQDGRHLRRRVPVEHAVPVRHATTRRAKRRAAGASRWSSWAAVRTASGRAWSSTTAACAPRWRCASRGTRRS